MGYLNAILILGGINVIAALGVSILTGYTGLFTIGHAGFMALGGYLSAILIKEYSVHFIPALLLGGFFAGVASLIIGYPSFRSRLRGDYFAIATLGFSEAIRLLLPFVSNLDEVRKAKQIIAGVEKELRAERIPNAEDIEIGVVVEVPAAVLLADSLAREADFFSLGTNDLTQSMLAVDRGNENVDQLFDPLHPAVLRAIQHVADAAYRMQIPINVCGEMASNPAQVIILLGLGLRDLSMTPNAIPAISIVRAITSR